MKHFLLKILSLLFFLSVSVIALLFAYGYRVDFDEYSLQQTSIIDVVNEFKDVDVFLDGEKSSLVLPFQFKGVLPGLHKLEIRKYGFKSFLKDVFVRTDYVSIVHDVFLLPNNVVFYLKNVFVFEKESVVVNGKRFYLGYQVGGKIVYVVFVDNENKFSFDDVKFHEAISSVIVFDEGSRFLLEFEKKGSYGYVDLESKRIFSFSLPVDVYNVNLDVKGDYVFYVENKQLFVIPVFELLQINEGAKFEFAKYLFKNNVDIYDLYGDKIYFIMNEKLVVSDFQYKNVVLFGDVKYKNLRVFSGNEFVILVIRTVAEERLLKIVFEDGVELLSYELYGNPFVSLGRGYVLFADDGGRVFVYDFYKDTVLFVGTFVKPFELLGMFFDNNYILIKNVNEEFVLINIFDGQQFVLFKAGDNYSDFISFDNGIFFLFGDKVKLFDYDLSK